MLKPENRLKKIRDFNLLFSRGRWVRGDFFDLKFLELDKYRQFFPKNENPDVFVKQLKIAFAVGLKLSKKAVKRNRLRRLMREAARLLVKENRIRNGNHILISARPGSLDLSFDRVSVEIERIMKKAGLFGSI